MLYACHTFFFSRIDDMFFIINQFYIVIVAVCLPRLGISAYSELHRLIDLSFSMWNNVVFYYSPRYSTQRHAQNMISPVNLASMMSFDCRFPSMMLIVNYIIIHFIQQSILLCSIKESSAARKSFTWAQLSEPNSNVGRAVTTTRAARAVPRGPKHREPTSKRNFYEMKLKEFYSNSFCLKIFNKN